MSVRGYAKWVPKADAAHWVRASAQVFEAYREDWPLSTRQVFYRLVAEYQYEKTEVGYNRLTQILSRSRRAGLLPWEAIRDGGLGNSIEAQYFASANDFENNIKRWAQEMQLDRQRDQDKVIELWCEAGGMVPILEGIAGPYSCQVNTGGGYDSVTAKHELALRVRRRARDGLKTLILHVGDFDGSGENMCEVLREDTGLMVVTQVLRAAAAEEIGGDDVMPSDEVADIVQRWREEGPDALDGREQRVLYGWAHDHFEVERVALTGEQVVERDVITAPPKRSDSRTNGFVERNWETVEALGTEDISAQLEALTPSDLRELITGVIEEHLDMDAYAAVLDEEAGVRADLDERLNR